ncbi:MAG: exosortase family protein XrtG [Lachnospiraceae bacterium]|nr:exosortase family protein XrtG [Lachnospiraceae bacterium]
MVTYIIVIALIMAWCYLLWATHRAKLQFWNFLVGSMGLFIILMLLVRPVMTEPLARAVAALAGLFGELTDTFVPYFKYGILFVESTKGALTLQIDFECSGIIEIMAFLSLLVFYRVYSIWERVVVGVAGTLYIMIANALRIIVICEMIHYMGTDVYYMAHTIVGRIVFYALSIVLYFYVFTKPQIIRMKIGKFNYGSH